MNKFILTKEYIKYRNSISQISKKLSCSSSTIWKLLKKYRIYIRTRSEAMKGKNRGKKRPDLAKRNRLQNMKGKHNPNFKDGRSLYQKCCMDCGKEITWQAERCFKCSAKQNMELRWKTSRIKILKSQWKGLKVTPNKLEKLLITFLNKLYPNEYKFVGDGTLLVDGLCPDFVDNSNTKIIELYGCYWHKCDKCGFGEGRALDRKRLRTYKKYGYETLIIWEHELKDLEKVKRKIKAYNGYENEDI